MCVPKKKRTFASQINAHMYRTHAHIIVSFLLAAVLWLCASVPVSAQELTDSVVVAAVDSVATDSVADPLPEWFVKPEIPKALRAPQHTTAAGCPLDSVLTFNIDSVLVEITLYEYDASGHTINQETWIVNADNSRVGKEKYEYGYTGSKQTMTAVYAWDTNTKNWKGTEKSEFTYSGSKMTSNTSFVWLNNQWVADKKYTYSFDDAGRNASYFEYSRNTSNNQLQYDQGFEYVWMDDTRKSLDIQYTAASNNVWTAGTKTELAYDGEDRQTLYAYSTMVNGAWVGESKETWGYTGPAGQLTLHETYVWYNNDWAMTVREIADFDVAGNQILIENYTGENGVTTGIQKEEYAFEGEKTVSAVIYKWSKGAWIGYTKEAWAFEGPDGKNTYYEKQVWRSGQWGDSIRETWEYNGPDGKQTSHERYSWNKDAASLLKTLDYKDTYDSEDHLINREYYTYTNGVPKGTSHFTYTYVDGKKMEYNVYAWADGVWNDSIRQIWEYNSPSNKQTKTEKSVWENGVWTMILQENIGYTGTTVTLKENYELIEGVWTGTKKEEYEYTSSKKTLETIYAWDNGKWVESTQEKWVYDTKKQLTQHQKYEWSEGAWLLMVEENNTYEGTTLVALENYERTEGVWKGTKKEEYTFEGGQKTKVLTYQWYGNAWIYQFKEEWTFTSGRQTLYEKHGWDGTAWIAMKREVAAFDEAGNQTLVENCALLSTTGWTGTKKEEYTYEGGIKTSTIVYAWVTDTWVESTKNEIGYQDGNTEVTEANYTWDGSAWVGSGTRTYTTKDSENRVTEQLTKNWPTGATEWTNDSITKNTYNDKGEKILTYNGTWNGSRWVVSSMERLDYIFDEEGRQLLKASWKCGLDSIWKGLEKDTVHYSATGKMLYRVKYNGWQNNDWVPSSKTENTYDANDRPIIEESYTWSSNKWRGVYRYESAYDAQGRRTSYAYYNSWNTTTNSWKGSSKQEYEFYKNYTDKYVSTTTYRWKNNKWTPSFMYTYTFDSSDREIDQIVQSYTNNSWVNSNRYVKQYSGTKLVKDSEYAWSNNQWSIRSLHEWTYDEDAQAKLRREIIGTWTSSGLTSYEDKHYCYACDTKYRVIQFVNYDGTTLQMGKVEEGTTPTYNGDTPTRPADAHYTYTFKGWSPTIKTVTANAVYTAIYTSTVNQYTITFKDEDGTTLKSETLDYGATPSCDAPTKAATDQYTFTFAGWSPKIVTVIGDATYTASYKSIINQYTVTFKDEDGTVIKSSLWNYGATPTCATPTKEGTDQYSYSFDGWDSPIVPVVGDVTYTATYKSTENQYTVTFRNYNGVVVESKLWNYGETPTCSEPTKPATAQYTYTFKGWTPAITTVKANAVYVADYDSITNIYTITFNNYNNALLQTVQVPYGETPVYTGETPVKPADEETSYDYIGWTPELVTVTGDATYTATYKSSLNAYTITFKDEDGTVLETKQWYYGKTPTYGGATPTKPATAQYTYSFDGWTPAVVDVTGDATYTATYKSTVNQYTVTFKDEDGTVIESKLWYFGETPSCNEPTKQATAQYTFSFDGWTPAITTVTGDATYTATYKSTVNQYTVTFKDEDGTVIESKLWNFGETPSCNTPSKPATDQYIYTFDGWTPAITTVTAEATYTATYKSTVNQYTVTFVNGDQVLQTGLVAYGETPVYGGATPTKDATAQYTYSFAGWDSPIIPVVGNVTYAATFTSTVNQYTVTFLDENGTTLKTETLDFGATPSCEDPTKPATAQYTFSFDGWTPAIMTVTGDATYTATYKSTVNTYTVIFTTGEKELQKTEVPYGETPVYGGATPTKEADAQYSYTFAGWDKTIVPVTEATTYTATFDHTLRHYTITFYYEDGTTIIEQVVVAAGETPECHYTPSMIGDAQHYYTFSGWSPEIVPAVADASYVPTFTKVARQYTITFKNYDGKELQVSKFDYDAMPEYMGETPTKKSTTQYNYVFKGWNPELVPVTGDATYRAQFETVARTYTITFYDEDGIIELDRVETAYGKVPSTSVVPTKEPDDEYRYSFAGWSPSLTKTTKDASYTATYKAVPRTQDIDDVDGANTATKVIIDNQIYILRGGKTYTIHGQLVEK